MLRVGFRLKPDLKRLAIAVIQAVGSYFIRGLNFPMAYIY